VCLCVLNRWRLKNWTTITTSPCSLMVCVRQFTPMSSSLDRASMTCWSTVAVRSFLLFHRSSYPSRVSGTKMTPSPFLVLIPVQSNSFVYLFIYFLLVTKSFSGQSVPHTVVCTSSDFKKNKAFRIEKKKV